MQAIRPRPLHPSRRRTVRLREAVRRAERELRREAASDPERYTELQRQADRLGNVVGVMPPPARRR